ncbi:hypothetical protein [Nocardia sp. AB354]|uniref:hypothetical protein n=1 Tax=Nocardia sp. AB354 TaxID=3413283 RepID=UPI003C275FF1
MQRDLSAVADLESAVDLTDTYETDKRLLQIELLKLQNSPDIVAPADPLLVGRARDVVGS